jgi:hypothetical protein
MSNLELNGKIKLITEVQEGTAKSGNAWKKCGFVVTTGGDYPKDIFFSVFGEEKVDNLLKFNKVGQDVDVSFNVDSREYNGKYYTDLQAWKIFGAGAKVEGDKPTNDGYSKASEVSDLPF